MFLLRLLPQSYGNLHAIDFKFAQFASMAAKNVKNLTDVKKNMASAFFAEV